MSVKITDAMIDAVLEYRREEARQKLENPRHDWCFCMGPNPVDEPDGREPTRRCACIRRMIAAEVYAALLVAPDMPETIRKIAESNERHAERNMELIQKQREMELEIRTLEKAK